MKRVQSASRLTQCMGVGVALIVSACSAPDPGGSSDGSSSSAGADGSSMAGGGGHLDPGATCDGSRVGQPFLRRLSGQEMDASLRDLFSLPDDWRSSFSSDPGSHLGFATDESLLLMSSTATKEAAAAAEEVADLVVADLGARLPCSASSADEACVESAIRDWGTKVFRRPPSGDEVGRYVAHFNSIADASDFSTGMKWTLVAMLQSPSYLFRSEIGVVEGGRRVLSDYEIATQLAYMYTGSTPDQTLLDRAAAGELQDAAVRREEAERLLDGLVQESQAQSSAAVFHVMQEFFRQWLSYHTINGKTRYVAGEEFPSEISWRMVQEMEMFLASLVFFDQGTVIDLLQSEKTFLDGKLSEFYGYGDVAGDAFQPVTRPEKHSTGVLAQGSLLAAHSMQEHTSPVFRGLLFLEKFLCQEAPTAPADIPSLDEAAENAEWKTNRDKYELVHSGSSSCANCHQAFEPFGYAFEGFDEAGRQRDTDNGYPVDAAVSDLSLPGEDGSYAVEGLSDLSNLVTTTTRIQECFGGMLEAYLYSGAGGEVCIAGDARPGLVSGELSIYDYLIKMGEMRHLAERQVGE